MACTGLELFMEKLKQMIYRKNNPPITNRRLILSQRPQFRLLYEELDSMIQTLFAEKEKIQLHELDEVKNLQKRFKDVAQDAHDIVDLFVSDILLKSKGLPMRSDDSVGTLNLVDIMRSLVSINDEFKSILANMKVDSFPITDLVNTQYAAVAGASCNKKLPRSKMVLDEIIGIDHDVALIRDKLVEYQKQIDVVSIVGMGGLGKTTLATKVFDDPFVLHHFEVRAWVTVSQTYDKHDLLTQIMASIGLKLETINASYSQLRQILHQRLLGRRYLVVIDDIWNTKA